MLKFGALAILICAPWVQARMQADAASLDRVLGGLDERCRSLSNLSVGGTLDYYLKERGDVAHTTHSPFQLKILNGKFHVDYQHNNLDARFDVAWNWDKKFYRSQVRISDQRTSSGTVRDTWPPNCVGSLDETFKGLEVLGMWSVLNTRYHAGNPTDSLAVALRHAAAEGWIRAADIRENDARIVVQPTGPANYNYEYHFSPQKGWLCTAFQIRHVNENGVLTRHYDVAVTQTQTVGGLEVPQTVTKTRLFRGDIDEIETFHLHHFQRGAANDQDFVLDFAPYADVIDYIERVGYTFDADQNVTVLPFGESGDAEMIIADRGALARSLEASPPRAGFVANLIHPATRPSAAAAWPSAAAPQGMATPTFLQVSLATALLSGSVLIWAEVRRKRKGVADDPRRSGDHPSQDGPRSH